MRMGDAGYQFLQPSLDSNANVFGQCPHCARESNSFRDDTSCSVGFDHCDRNYRRFIRVNVARNDALSCGDDVRANECRRRLKSDPWSEPLQLDQ